ncbi:uncharacterized protein LOC130787890 [Actinidia eriantha]|uniref:uncharacterized protein LOC130787890 n=1 Tax=Actinidia eriantha TaxID=165200 RepID=UPI002591021D|nr:uncharacterized protein LOC130787890 [Actinidia eriantha]
MWPFFPWGGHPQFPIPGGPWAHHGNGWALPPLPAHKFPPFTWPKPGNGWALPPLPAHKFPPFTWPKPGNGWALPPLPAHKFPPFTWPKPGNGWAFPPLPAHKFPPFPWGHASSTQSSESPNKCWSSLQEVEGCVNDIASSFWAGKFNVGRSCCKTFTDIKDDCSINGSGAFDVPFFHQALQHHCSSQVAPPSKA